MARANVQTLLSLDRWAQIMGLNPVSFNGAILGPNCYQACTKCRELWNQHPWQSSGGYMAREDLAWAIADAERDIKNFLGVPLCPELHCMTLPYLPPSNQISCGWNGSYSPRPAYQISECPIFFLPRQAERLLGIASLLDDTMVILDEEGDFYDGDECHCPVEVQATLHVSRDNTEPFTPESCQIFVRYQGRTEEIKGAKVIEVIYDSIENEDLVQIIFDSWRLIEPSLWENAGPYAGEDSCVNCGIDILDSDNLVDYIEIWQRYHDPSMPIAEFGWECDIPCGCGDPDCPICRVQIQPACVIENTRGPGFVVPFPARWNAGEEAWGRIDPWTCWRQPDFVRFYYWTGYLPKGQCPPESLCAVDCSQIEQIIAILAAARMTRRICSCTCGESKPWWEELQTNTSKSTRETGTYVNTVQTLNNPFGTRVGEIDAYRRLDLIKSELCGGYVTSTAI